LPTPLQFGDSRRPLYGVYHPPAGRAERSRAIVLCNPFGEEAVRAFRIYRLLAEKLADGGAHVLRFDYFATGDSAGPCEAASLSGFVESILEAQTELLDMSGARESAFIGLRLGAAAAFLAAAKTAQTPAFLVLWDPVVSGRDYLEELRRGHEAAIAAQLQTAPSGREEALGFALAPAFVEELQRLEMGPARAPARKIFVTGGAAARAFADAQRAAGAEIVWRDDPGEASWNSDAALNAFIVPARTLAQIAADALS
jgi:pimeloyl-ACP methyl ester carboxylesterase